MASSLKKSKHLSASKMKASLKKLEKDDPEFVKFMKAMDTSIFDFDESSTSEEEEDNEKTPMKQNDKDSDIDDDDDDDDDMEEDDEDIGDDMHQMPKKLKTASDSDSEMEEESASKSGKKKRLVTLKMIRHWSKLMQERNSIPALQDLMCAFKSAVQQTRDEGQEEVQTKFKVEGTAVFNAVVSASVVEIPAFLKRFLEVKESKDGNKLVLPSTSNKWKRVKVDVKSYATDLLQLLGHMASADVISVLLKHVHQMITYVACFPKLPKLLLKRLIQLWSKGEETSRLLAFMSIMRLVLLQTDALLEFSLKHMYRTYVSNCKFTSVNTLHLINFMQRCLVEMFGVRLDLTYHFAFIYIRQLAIHLRNAITLQKKDCIQTVYNWQFIHSLFLWTRLVSAHYTDESIRSLIHPLTQIIMGTIKLVPSAQYFPLRFHCVRALNMLSESTGVYIPVIPFLTQVLDAPELRRKPKAAGAKAFIFPCILKLTKPQVQDKAFQDGVLEQLYELFLIHVEIHSHTLGFPELILPPQMQIKKFIKTCKIPAHVKKLKQLVDKVEEASKVTIQRRKNTTISLQDSSAVQAWEERNKSQGNPLSTFVTNWKKLRERLLAVNHDQMLGSDLPKIERPKGPKLASVEDRKEFSELFESGDEDSDSDTETRFLLKEERTEKKSEESNKGKELPKKRKRGESTSESDYSDLDDEELEALNRSASEDSDSDDDDDDDDDGSDGDDDEDDKEDADDGGDDIVKDFNFSEF